LSTAVEVYLEAKGIDYHLDGDNATFDCPFCDDNERKFGINIHNWKGHCFKAKCDIGVNEITFKRKFGDSVVTSNFEDVAAQVRPAAKKSTPEVPPDPEIAHKALLEDTEVMNFLNDSVGFSMATIKRAKLGLAKRKFSPRTATAEEKLNWPPSRALTFPYFRKGKCYGVKYKTLPPEEKDFRYTKDVDLGLYNEDVIKKDMESLILVEGEKDCLTLLDRGYDNVVGIPGAKVKNAFWADMLDLPKKLYLCMDNDEVGVEGAKAFATRFGIERIHIVNIPHLEMDEPVIDKHGTRTTTSDVTDFFQAGGTKEQFDELLAEAKAIDIEGVTSMQDAFDEIIADYEERGNLDRKYKFMWPSVNLKAKGIDDGDLIVILAARKVGKTTFVLNQLEHMLTTHGINIHFECMEMTPKQLTKKWAAMHMGTNEDDMTIAQFKEAKAFDRARNNHFYFTQSSPKTEDEAFNIMRKTARRYGIGAGAFDNLQLLVDTTIPRSDRNQRPAYISSITKKFKKLAGELKYPLFLISQPKNVPDGEMVSGNDSEGSGATANDCDLLLTLNRDREAKMKMASMASLGKFETNASHSSVMYVETAYSRRSEGGFVTLKIDGAKSIIREFSSEEANANTIKTLANGIQIINEEVAAAI